MPTLHGQNVMLVKQENILLVLDVIERFQPISRTDIAALADISPASVTRITAALLRYGLIYESESVTTGQRGRKAVCLSLKDDGMYTAGVCLEADRLLMCVMDISRRVLAVKALSFAHTLTEDRPALARLAHDALLTMPCGDRISSVGVSVAGTVDPLTGRVTRSDQMGWSNVELGEIFTDAFGIRTWIENDVKACLIGEEQRTGEASDEDTAYILVGTGLGVAVSSNGRLIRGIRNEAGEIEHLPFPGGDTLAEHLVERNLVARAARMDASITCVSDVMTAYAMRLHWAQVLMNDFKTHLSFVIGLVNGLFDPERVVIGGSIVPHIAPLLDDWVQSGRVSLGEDYDHACMIGAARLCMRHAIHALIKEGNEGVE